MKVGDYARTKDGRISKIYDIQKNDLYILEDYNYSYNSDWLVKSSPNIIDLIEVGDYVNGKEIEQIIGNELYFETSDMASEISFKANDIKSIVTKEQFESIKYEVGE